MALSSLFLMAGCESESVARKPCGTENPTTNLRWLNELISEAENDQSGNHRGTVWIQAYQGQDYVVTDMALGSGGLAFHCFDCSGTANPVDDIEFYNTLANSEIVFSNVE